MPAIASRGRGRRTISEINMVPFIDVMLVLLIIFMVTAPLITPSVIDLPSIGKAGRQPDRVIQIVIQKDESVILKLDGKDIPVGIGQLAARLIQSGELKAQTPVVISADRQVKYDVVVKVMDTLQRAGVQRLGLSVQLTHR
jgi:biopolymer transport protein TolR